MRKLEGRRNTTVFGITTDGPHDTAIWNSFGDKDKAGSFDYGVGLLSMDDREDGIVEVLDTE